MQLLFPIGLLALTGLIIPVLLHLWSVKQGKTLKIGSVVLLGENATTSAKSFKLTDLLLFFLRCVIIVFIAFIIAQPYVKKTNISSKNKGWILMDRAQLKDVYDVHHNIIDSLLTLGFELHDFNLGFNKFSLSDTLKTKRISSGLTYNSLLNQLNREIPSGYSAYLFADRRLVNFDGDLPALNFNLIWKNIERNDTLKTWSSTFLGKVYHAKSTPNLTSYRAEESPNLPVTKVMIYEPSGIDSKYIKACLRAIADFTKRKVEIQKSANEADIIFWLSDQAIHINWNKSKTRLLSYQKGKTETINSTLQLIARSTHAITLKKRVAFNQIQGTTVWIDGFGKPILIKENETNHFHFYSRFNPQWTDLVWDEQFVEAMIPIVLASQYDADFGFETNGADQRLLAKTQFVKSKNSQSNFSTKPIHKNIDYIIWMLAFVVLVIERILSFRQKNISYAKG